MRFLVARTATKKSLLHPTAKWFIKQLILENKDTEGYLGDSVTYVSPFSLGHDPRILGSCQAWNSLLSLESPFLSLCPSLPIPSCLYAGVHGLSLSNK